MSWEPHVTVASVVEKDGQFLFVEELSGGKKVINQPAGHVDEGESIADAAIRETLEETGWHIELQHLIAIYRWRHDRNGETFFRFTFLAKPLKHEADQPLDDGIIRALWLDPETLRQQASNLRSPMVLRALDDHFAGQHFPLSVLVDL